MVYDPAAEASSDNGSYVLPLAMKDVSPAAKAKMVTYPVYRPPFENPAVNIWPAASVMLQEAYTS